MDTNALLDALKARKNLVSERALSRELGITAPALRELRALGLSEERALQIATLLEIPPEEVLPAIRAERAKSPEVKAVWKRISESMRSALGVLAAGIAVAVVASSSTDQPLALATLAPTYYVKCFNPRPLVRAGATHLFQSYSFDRFVSILARS